LWASFGSVFPQVPSRVRRLRDVVGDEDHIDPVGFQELGQGLMVGPRGLHGTDDLGGAGLPPTSLEVGPEGFEACGRVRDRQLLVQELCVGEADLGHVLGLRDVDPDQEPVALGAEVLLEFTKALDSDCI
jgi:hypothetical protein